MREFEQKIIDSIWVEIGEEYGKSKDAYISDMEAFELLLNLNQGNDNGIYDVIYENTVTMFDADIPASEKKGKLSSYAVDTEKLLYCLCQVFCPNVPVERSGNKSSAFLSSLEILDLKKPYCIFYSDTGNVKWLDNTSPRDPRATYISRGYMARNKYSHKDAKYSMTAVSGVSNIIIMFYLEIASRYQDKIKEYYERSVKPQEPDFSDYIRDIINGYDTREYVSIELQMDNTDNTDHPASASIDKIMEEAKRLRLILVGNAGTGKTTTLLHMQYITAKQYMEQKSDKIPVFIESRYLKEMIDNSYLLPAVSRLIFKTVEKIEECRRLITNQRIVFYIDGLDEIRGSNDTKRQIIDELEAYILKDNAQVIVSDRVNSRITVNKNVLKVLRMSRMSEEIVKEFIQRFAKEEVKDKMLQEIFEVRYSEVIATPYMLRILIDNVNLTGQLQNDMGKLMEDSFRRIFQREREKGNEAADYDTISLFLEALGEELFNRDSEFLSKRKVLKLFDKCMERYHISEDYHPDRIITLLTDLDILSNQDGNISFSNDMMKEFVITNLCMDD